MLKVQVCSGLAAKRSSVFLQSSTSLGSRGLGGRACRQKAPKCNGAQLQRKPTKS